jgi:asparagine synthase (glutamine-hydrolysing)
VNPFLCVVDLRGDPVGLDALTAALPAIGQTEDRVEVLFSGSCACAWVPSAALRRPVIVHRHGILALGNVRVTNRSNFPAPAPAGDRWVDDLDLIVEHYLRRGVGGFRDLVGDFAFVLWDTRQNELVAARDALGIKSLFYQERDGRIALGSHLDCFEPTQYDREFLADFLVGHRRGTKRTIFSDVKRLEPGAYLTARAGRVDTSVYWSPAEFVASERISDEQAAVDEFRALFRDAVEAQLEDGLPSWSHLSGGLDSSSVVAMAECLADQNRVAHLAGTETVVDSLGDGNETRYSDLVAGRLGVPNHRVTDYWAWQSDELGPPAFAEPRPFLPFFARDRAMRDLVRDQGGKVLLSGFGSDNYLSGTFDFIADWVAKGRFKDAARQLVDLAVATRRSVWEKARQHILVPFAPGWLQRRLIRDLPVPPWLSPAFVADHGLESRMSRVNGVRPGGLHSTQQVAEFGSIDLAIERGVFEEGIEMRYPFLHRPLVEFALRLPVELRFRPKRAKWILREAMGPLLPDQIRERQGKGGIDSRIVWSFERERPLLERLIADSHLADLGCVSRDELARAFAQARTGAVESVVMLFVTLSLETWLAVRSGWWKRHSRTLSSYHPITKEQHHVEAGLR